MASHSRPVQTSYVSGKVLPGEPSQAGSTPNDWLHLLWVRRSVLKSAVICGVVISGATAFLLPNYYISSARIVPPGASSAIVLGGHIIRLSPALLVGVMYSTSVQDEIIDRFHLMELYGTNLREDARHQLEDHTEIVEDLPSGIITISVTDRSPQRASEMARAYITGLNRCLGRVNTSAAHKERVFIEERLRDTRQRLDESARKFSDFSSKNAVINVTEQGKVLLESAAHLQGQLIAARSSLAGLEQIYTPGHARMRSLRARTMDLQQQLQAMTKVEGKRQVDVHKEDNFTYPSIQKLPLLAQKYFDLLRQKMVYESVLGALSQEYERAKLEEAKGLPSVRVIDLPVVPEKRAGPLRIVVVLCGILLSVLFGSAWILAKNYFPATWPARRSIAVNHNSHP